MAEPRPVKIGLFLTNQFPVGSDVAAGLAQQLALARAARDAGWDSVWAGQHFLPSDLAMPQLVPFLARLTADAGEMAVGVGIVLLALQNPVDVAETFATLDLLSGGRMIFGVGLGYREVEYLALGVPLEERRHRFEENLRIVRALWRGDEVDVDLSWCRLDRIRSTLLPMQRPGPPIWMAANSDAAVRRAARLADAWFANPHASLATIAAQRDLYAAARTEAGLRPPEDVPLMREIFCARDRATAFEQVAPFLARKYQVYARWGQDKVLPGEVSFDVPLDELTEDRFVIGSPEDCLGPLVRCRDELGVDHFVLRLDWAGMPPELALESLALIDREIVPVLRDVRSEPPRAPATAV
jgi:alkanesulfonate monooxygenase SsuD/methylene tetrahydromethanopterin reductase-like flavin-dependent oxidoreductase (luciferase family)